MAKKGQFRVGTISGWCHIKVWIGKTPIAGVSKIEVDISGDKEKVRGEGNVVLGTGIGEDDVTGKIEFLLEELDKLEQNAIESKCKVTDFQFDVKFGIFVNNHFRTYHLQNCYILKYTVGSSQGDKKTIVPLDLYVEDYSVY